MSTANESWQRLCSTDDVGVGLPYPARVSSTHTVAVFLVEGSYFATDNICTHGNALLTDGFQEGSTINCPLHGGAFDIATGEPVARPCRVALKTYPVERHGDELFIAAGGQARKVITVGTAISGSPGSVHG